MFNRNFFGFIRANHIRPYNFKIFNNEINLEMAKC